MKKLFIISVLLIFSYSIFAQAETSDCKVLLKEIADVYKGECKKGLAHGQGYAEGWDTYEGSFKKGLPDGKGKYLWNSGNVYVGEWKKGAMEGKGVLTIKTQEGDSIVEGYWKDNDYIGVTARPITYKILENRGIPRTNFYKVDDSGDKIEFFFTMMGNNLTPQNLQYYMTTGTESSMFIGYNNVEFPVTCYMTYQATNQLGSDILDYSLTFEIYESGTWEIHLYH